MGHPNIMPGDNKWFNAKCPMLMCHQKNSKESISLIVLGKNRYHCNGCKNDFTITVRKCIVKEKKV